MTRIGSTSSVLGFAPLAFARGSWVMLGFCVFLFFAVVVGYFTQTGSAITPRPYGKVYGGAPGAIGPGEVSGRDPRERVDWARGTR
jgi:hypothetical protein